MNALMRERITMSHVSYFSAAVWLSLLIAAPVAAQTTSPSKSPAPAAATAPKAMAPAPGAAGSQVCARLFSDAARPLPQAGQTKPSGQRRSNRNAAQLVSSGKLAWNSLRDRALATGRPLAPAAGGWPRRHYTSYGAPWDNGISLA